MRGTPWQVLARMHDPKYVEEAGNWMLRTGFGSLYDTAWAATRVSSLAVPKSHRIPRNELLPDKL
jgi:hypothetical protein